MSLNLNVLNKLNINKKDFLVVSVSGGVDSLVLLNLLLNNNYKNLIVVHFNHQTRKENVEEEKLVKETALKHNLKFYLFNFNYSNKDNFQNEARLFRYKNLEKVALKHNTKYILTAHHLDDLAETILIKLTRGSNLYGYAGMHHILNKNNFTYIRPLLNFNKESLYKYALKHNIKYLEDISNFDTNYLRNRYRHTIIPIMKQENNDFLNNLLKYNELLTNSHNFIRNYAKKFIASNKIIIDEIINEDNIIQNEALTILLENENIEFNYNLINDLNRLLNSDKPNLTYNIHKNYIFVKSYNKAYIKKLKTTTSFEIILKEGENTLPNMKKITFLNNDSNNDKLVNKLCYNEISLPLIARTRKNGDVLKFSYGSKKLKDFLIDKKIPKLKRDKLIIITDNENNILFVEDLYINKQLGNKNKIYFKIGD